jgi:hypothetical protein
MRSRDRMCPVGARPRIEWAESVAWRRTVRPLGGTAAASGREWSGRARWGGTPRLSRVRHAGIRYTAARLGIFVVVFVLVLLLAGPDDWIWAALAAALISLTSSYLFLRPLRDQWVAQMQAGRGHDGSPEGDDEHAEDAEVDGATAPDAQTPDAAVDAPAQGEAPAHPDTEGDRPER